MNSIDSDLCGTQAPLTPQQTPLTPAMRYSEELKDDLTLSMMNLREKAMTCSAMKAKWVGYQAKEKDALKRIQTLRTQYTQNLAAKKGGVVNAFDKIKNLNSQQDETLKKIDETKKEIDLALEVIAHAISSFTEFGYNIKTFFEIVKMNNS